MAVKKSRPSHKVVFPPAGAIKDHTVKTGEDWGSISKRYCGRKDPWELIEFNFGTRDAAEVNWCLHEYVGCRTSKDGKNYSFDNSDLKGKIYLPPPQWRPSLDKPLRRLVVDALSHFAANSINFRRGPFTIDSRNLNKIANYVIDGRIRIYQDDGKQHGTAYYLPKINSIVLAKGGFADAVGKSALVHECVHALMDKEKFTMTVGISESIAFVAQTIYLLKRAGKRLSVPLPSGNIFDPVYREVLKLAYYQELLAFRAYSVAQFVLDRKPIPNSAWKDLDNALASHPQYRTMVGRDGGFDGI